MTHGARAAALALGLAICLPVLPAAAASPPSGAEALTRFDPDADGTVSWREVEAAAEQQFQALDRDHDGTVSQQEIGELSVSAEEFSKSNPDTDKTLDKAEYLRLVKRLFTAANTDQDGTLNRSELDSEAGQRFLRFLHAAP